MMQMERNRVWTGDDLRALRNGFRIAGDAEGAAKRLDRDLTEVEGMLTDLGWIEAPPPGHA
jgi:hypothetical protein